MSPRAPIKFYLVHLETGQRYPVLNEDVVIGRTSGDILVGHDDALATQHCRIVVGPIGLSIHDLNSETGTEVDGVKLDPQKLYALKADSVFKIGAQVFRLTEARAKTQGARVKRKKKKVKPRAAWPYLVIGVAFCAAVVFAATHGGRKEARRAASSKTATAPLANPATPSPAITPLATPFDLVNRDLENTLTQYRRLGQATRDGQIADRDLIRRIRQEFNPAINLMSAKLETVRPTGEYERQVLEIDRELLRAMSLQLQAMAEGIATHSEAATERLHASTESLQRIGQRRKALTQSRAQDVR